MNPEDIGRILDEIGERIGPAGEYAWQLTVRQVVIEGWVFGVAAIVAGVVAAIVAALLIRGGMKDDGSDGCTVFVYGCIFGLFGIAASFAAAASFIRLLNPEYHAMVQLLERLVP